MKKILFILLQLFIISSFVFSSEYEEELEITDVEIVQNLDGNCFVMYKTIDGSVKMFIENHFYPQNNGEFNFFNNSGNIKATSSFYTKEMNYNLAVCFTGLDEEERNNLFIFAAGLNLKDYFSHSILFSDNEKINIKDIIFSDTDEISVFFTNNDVLYCEKINLLSNEEVQKVCFSGYTIDELKVNKLVEKDGTSILYGVFSSNNNLYIYNMYDETETFQQITNNTDGFYYTLDNKQGVCYVSDGEIFTKINYGKSYNIKSMPVNLNINFIKDIIGVANKINIIMRGDNLISSITLDLLLDTIEEQGITSYETEPFIYIDKNQIFDESIIMIVKDDAIYSFSDNTWKYISSYKDFEQNINSELSNITKENEKEFELKIERINDSFTYYVAQINNVKFIPLYKNNYIEQYSAIKSTRAVNNLFYTFIKNNNKINILSRME